MMPFNLLKVRPRNRIGIIDAQSWKIVIGHVFGCTSRSHCSWVFEHGFVGGGEGGWGYLIDFGLCESAWVVFGRGVGADVAGASWGVDVEVGGYCSCGGMHAVIDRECIA